MTELYRVLISGRTISGRPLAEISDQVGAAFKLQGDQLAQMLCGRPVTVVKSATGAVAEQWLVRLRSLDLEAIKQALNPVAPVAPAVPAAPANATAESLPPVAVTTVAEVVCPKCGEAQPKRTLCRQCGLDMPRYEQAQQQAAEEAQAERLATPQTRSYGPIPGPRVAADIDGASLVGIGFDG